VSVRENVYFNQKHECIEGFGDYGTQRTCNIANHTLVFMAGGLHRQWKQPVAYCFSCGSTKANLLVRCLDEVPGACQNARLQVVATICNMGANSIKALKLLDATSRKPFLKFQNQDIVTVYFPAQLLKCTRNLILKYNVPLESEFMHNQLPVTAKWEHILNIPMGQAEYFLPFLLAHGCPSVPCDTGCNESQLGCTGDEPHCWSKSKCFSFCRYGTLLCLNCVVIRSKVTYEFNLLVSMKIFLSDFTMTMNYY